MDAHWAAVVAQVGAASQTLNALMALDGKRVQGISTRFRSRLDGSTALLASFADDIAEALVLKAAEDFAASGARLPITMEKERPTLDLAPASFTPSKTWATLTERYGTRGRTQTLSTAAAGLWNYFHLGRSQEVKRTRSGVELSWRIYTEDQRRYGRKARQVSYDTYTSAQEFVVHWVVFIRWAFEAGTKFRMLGENCADMVTKAMYTAWSDGFTTDTNTFGNGVMTLKLHSESLRLTMAPELADKLMEFFGEFREVPASH